MPEQLESAPFVAIFAFFFAVAFVRTQATYWVARVVATQTLERTTPRNRLLAQAQAWSTTPAAQRGVATVNRWGVLAVPLSFCAVGTKTVVNGAAGLTRMPFLTRYLPALVVGCLIHATIYATIGWAAWTAAISAATGSPWGAVALVVLLLLTVLGVLHVARARRRSTAARTAGS
ncbi:hypothetical protein Sked_13640 [Sanguibacter keddieii DSM 10542]|uniref:Membrane-associated protein n=1 Tax=Sanguibacter keddieii (strain ATCC 51767 / DSM 10542 / NCFB 3025 / ST-74) TaxID=446469 RepID=D1BF08_SANKS|nr:hypothetical protein [Sanguibacter keddieii]ACZ21304.1 hypothetical protein Sked_13640 [Sanguibacter keddieii DSM 10542]